MKKHVKLLIVGILLISFNSFGQETIFEDGKIVVEKSTERHEDPTNDKFYEYHAFTIENRSDENVEFRMIIHYSMNGNSYSSENGDLARVFQLSPGQSLTGNETTAQELIMFKEFLPGKSGQKASESITEIKSIEIEYL